MPSACCLCGESRYRLLEPVASSVDRRPFTPAVCEGCGLVGLEPRLPLHELLTYYEGLTSRSDLEEKIRARFVPRCEWIDHLLPKKGRILDVGCGRGQFPAQMRDRGWQAEGIEANPLQAAAGRAEFGLTIHEAPFDQWSGPGTYQAITAWHVLEHFIDPTKALANAAALLAPGGLFFAEVPNFASLGRAWGGADWVHYDVPFHQHFFTPASLTALAEKSGLEVLGHSRQALDSDWWSIKRTLQRRLTGFPAALVRPLISIKPVAWMIAWAGALFGYTETFQLVARKRT